MFKYSWSCSGFEAAFTIELDFVIEFDFGSHSAFVSGMFASDVECDETIYFRKGWFQGVACTLMLGCNQVL